MKDKKNDLKDESLEFADQKIIPVNMEKEVKKSFIEYSMSVIVSRALPDVRDGMKPGARRVLYGGHLLGQIFSQGVAAQGDDNSFTHFQIPHISIVEMAGARLPPFEIASQSSRRARREKI